MGKYIAGEVSGRQGFIHSRRALHFCFSGPRVSYRLERPQCVRNRGFDNHQKGPRPSGDHERVPKTTSTQEFMSCCRTWFLPKSIHAKNTRRAAMIVIQRRSWLNPSIFHFRFLCSRPQKNQQFRMFVYCFERSVYRTRELRLIGKMMIRRKKGHYRVFFQARQSQQTVNDRSGRPPVGWLYNDSRLVDSSWSLTTAKIIRSSEIAGASLPRVRARSDLLPNRAQNCLGRLSPEI
jgi:hypothetical protein